MNSRLLLGLLVGGALLLGAFLVAGGYNVSAAAGHLPPVAALMHWTMQNSVTMRARAKLPADLQDGARARAGAGHYDLVCRDCHGAPGEPLTAVARSLEPPPPHILDAVSHWGPQELFWIVKHGIKMTAMPAWPAQQRDDEVWSLVAFLLRLPDMTPEAYRRMTEGALAREAPRPVASDFEAELARCAICHGYTGRGFGAYALPRLDGQSARYLAASLEAFATGRRASGVMQAHASMASDRHLPALARHFGVVGESELWLEKVPRAGSQEAAAVPEGAPGLRAGGDGFEESARDRGERLALEGDRERRLPACAACHGPAAYPRAASYPRLAGQAASYLRVQLELFRSGTRGGSRFAPVMHLVARNLEDGDIEAVARYYSELRP